MKPRPANPIDLLPTDGAGRAIAPTPPPRRSRVVTETIEQDVACPRCGYNLRGLPFAADCPECGVPVDVRNEPDDPLDRMPFAVIRRFLAGLAATSLTAMLALAVVTIVGAAGLWRTPAAFASIATLGVLWIVAVRLVTPSFDAAQAVFHGFGPREPVRSLARWCPVGLIVPPGLLLLGTVLPGVAPGDLLWSAALAGIAGVIGLAAYAQVLERLATWTRDAAAGRAASTAVWSLPASYLCLLVGAAFGGKGLFPLTFFGLGAIGFAASLFLVLGTTLILCLSVAVSLRHAHVHAARLLRRRERERREREARRREALQRRIDAIDAPEPARGAA